MKKYNFMDKVVLHQKISGLMSKIVYSLEIENDLYTKRVLMELKLKEKEAELQDLEAEEREPDLPDDQSITEDDKIAFSELKKQNE